MPVYQEYELHEPLRDEHGSAIRIIEYHMVYTMHIKSCLVGLKNYVSWSQNGIRWESSHSAGWNKGHR